MNKRLILKVIEITFVPIRRHHEVISTCSPPVFVFKHFSPSYADTLRQQSIRVQQQQNQLEQQLAKIPDLYLSEPIPSVVQVDLTIPEHPCRPINTLSLKNPPAVFSFLIPALRSLAAFEPGMCLGIGHIQYLEKLAQNIVIDEGFIMT